jgi:tetratricopeptide (TPR) repeat protein/tRNA A-37 threonylcarbamoyl transferase component Bud32
MSELRDRLQASLGDSYRIERELGGGGMSRVFVAEDVSLGRRVALKVLPPELAGPMNADRFRREILLAAKLQDPHIVAVLSAGQTEDGTPYYTMPLVDGESLRACLGRRGAMPISDIVPILKDVAKALAYAHELGVVHRDIKPDNVLLTRRDALVADFGVAKALSSARDQGPNPTLTVAGTSLGTPAYMAPEQVAADPNMDHRADIYALGVMAYEMLAGAPPFIGSAPQRILAAHLSQPPEEILSRRADTPVPLAALVMRCLAKEPGERPQTAGAVLEELDALTTSGGFTAAPAINVATKRSLGRALAIYVVSFAAVAILARAAVVGIGLPEWVFPGALIMMALGLPVLLFTGLVHHQSRMAHTLATQTPGGTRQPYSTMTQLSVKASPHVTWRRTAVGGAVAMGIFVLSIAGYMAMRMMGIGPAGSLLAAGVLDQRAPVLIAEFQSGGQDTLLGSVVTEAFRTDLGQSRAVTAVQPVFIQEALQRMQADPNTKVTAEVARELATREGIKLVVDGEVSPVGAGYLLSARLVSPASGEILAAFRETAASGDDLIPAIDRLSKRTREKIGESIKSVRASPPLEQVTTGSLDALRRYTQALNPMTDYDRGLQLLEDAIALDTTFAMAYRRLGTMHANRGEMVRARPMIERAYAYRERLPTLEKYLTEGSYWGTAMGDRARAIAAYEAALEVSPTNLTALNNVALLYGAERDYPKQEAYLTRALAVDTTFINGYANLAYAQVSNGKLQSARRTIDYALRRFPADPVIFHTDITLSLLEGDASGEQRLRAAASRMRTPIERLTYAELTARLALLKGRISEYERIQAEIAPIARARTARPARLDLTSLVDEVVTGTTILRDRERSGAKLDAALQSGPYRDLPVSERPYLAIARAAALLGRPEVAREMLQQWETHSTPAQRNETGEAIRAVRGLTLMAERRHADAVNETRAAVNSDCPVCVLPALGIVYDSAGMRDSVVAVYERYLSTTDMRRTWFDPWFAAGMHERLAELYERSGDRTRAAAHLNKFVEQWEDADPSLQPRVRAARATLARLNAPGSS